MKILRNGKWDGLWDRPKYQEIREKILDAFKDLEFEEGPHKYYLHGRELTCVSNVTHAFQEHFDAKEKAKGCYERHYNDPTSPYFRKTAAEIEKMWTDNSKQACEFGTERHEFGESCFYFMTGQYDKILPEFKDRLIQDEQGYGFRADFLEEEAAAQFYEDLPVCYIPILAETKVFKIEKEYAYSGTFDLLTYYDAELDGKPAEKSGLVIMDWKTNKNLYKSFKGKTLLEPFTELLDMPVSIYKLQLSLYQLALESIGLKVIARRLMWLRRDGTYDRVILTSVADRLDEALRIKNIV